MKFIHRLSYYLGGFALGLVILAFFLSGKKTSCDYTPDARVLKNIRIKERAYSTDALMNMRLHNIDTSHISKILRDGDVDFGRSDTEKEPCKTYWISGSTSNRKLEFLFENCDSLATMQEIRVLE